jgi:hypothetical protein
MRPLFKALIPCQFKNADHQPHPTHTGIHTQSFANHRKLSQTRARARPAQAYLPDDRHGPIFKMLSKRLFGHREDSYRHVMGRPSERRGKGRERSADGWMGGLQDGPGA